MQRAAGNKMDYALTSGTKQRRPHVCQETKNCFMTKKAIHKHLNTHTHDNNPKGTAVV